MVHFKEKARYDYDDLLEIIRVLRSPEGCPWDQVQTHQSIRRGLLEEAYEAAEGIDRDDADLLREELGDVLMQVVFHADIERQRGRFTMEDVVDGVVKKLIFRHPHVFGGAEPEKDAQSVLVSWDAIKRREKHQRTTAQAMDSVARSLPALWRAEKIQSKTAKAGFDWTSSLQALDKLEAVIQHNQSDIRTWLPLEYDLQKTYAAEAVKGVPFLERLQEESVKETERKIEEYSRK